jgi:hypothetical protein
MQSHFICDKCKQKKIEIWLGQPEPHADDGQEPGVFICHECRQNPIGYFHIIVSK